MIYELRIANILRPPRFHQSLGSVAFFAVSLLDADGRAFSGAVLAAARRFGVRVLVPPGEEDLVEVEGQVPPHQ